MTRIKLSRLPDRTPVKLTINFGPDLNKALVRYARFYHAQYGREESVSELAAAMIEAFLNSDKAFMRWCREAANEQG